MARSLAVILDPLDHLNPEKDTSIALMDEAIKQGWWVYALEPSHLSWQAGQVMGRCLPLHIDKQKTPWYTPLAAPVLKSLAEMDVVLVRTDPPVDMNYFYVTHLLEHLAAAGVLVINRPQSLRDANEKLFTLHFADVCPPTWVGAEQEGFRHFLAEQNDIIAKPLNGMGGAGIFRLQKQDANISVIWETLSEGGKTPFMAQQYLKEIRAGDKRILMFFGEPVPYALARLPTGGETRANLAAGGRGVGVELTARDREICARVGPVLREKGLYFVGLDVIGDYLTEINVTSPTCVVEIEKAFKVNIRSLFFKALEEKLSK